MSSPERAVPMRLQKFLARAGAASRRGSENLMSAGRVTVNGRVVSELGSKVDPLSDKVEVDGREIRLADGPVTLMLHKPAGVLTTMDDPQGRPTVAGLVPARRFPGLFPVGRLDFDTTGLLLFSTDGALGNGLLHPRHHVMKRYLAWVEGRPTPRELALLRCGVDLDDGPASPAEASLLSGDAARRAALMLDAGPGACGPRRRPEDRCIMGVGIREGRKRQVRRMLAAVGHPAVALHRDSFGPIELGSLPRGAWRLLDEVEVADLHRAIVRED